MISQLHYSNKYKFRYITYIITFFFFLEECKQNIIKNQHQTKQTQDKSDWNISSTFLGRVSTYTSMSVDKTAFLAEL